jgi:hypothetical protein
VQRQAHSPKGKQYLTTELLSACRTMSLSVNVHRLSRQLPLFTDTHPTTFSPVPTEHSSHATCGTRPPADEETQGDADTNADLDKVFAQCAPYTSIVDSTTSLRPSLGLAFCPYGLGLNMPLGLQWTV